MLKFLAVAEKKAKNFRGYFFLLHPVVLNKATLFCMKLLSLDWTMKSDGSQLVSKAYQCSTVLNKWLS